jgi:pimeloyl-ACP methyl ester carboxylesterase
VARRRLAACTFPVLALIGNDETLHDGALMAERFTEQIPNADVVVVDDANHLVFIDQTELVVDRLQEFLEPLAS